MSRVFSIVMNRPTRLLSVFGSVVNALGTNPCYREPQAGDARLDFLARSNDWRAVGRRMKLSLDRVPSQYGQ